jgi:hypothetical protein
MVERAGNFNYLRGADRILHRGCEFALVNNTIGMSPDEPDKRLDRTSKEQRDCDMPVQRRVGMDRALPSGMHDSHQKTAEYHKLAAHAYRAAVERHEKEDHLTGHERSRQALEYSNRAYEHAKAAHNKSGRLELSMAAPNRAEVPGRDAATLD